MMVYSRIFQDRGAGGELESCEREESGGSRLAGGGRPAEDAESWEAGRRRAGEGKDGDRARKEKKRREGKKTSFEAVLDGDPARFVIGLRMMLEFLQGQERGIACGANVHVHVSGR